MSNHFETRSPQLSAQTPTSSGAAAADDPSYRLALTMAQAADDRKGGDIVMLHVAEVSYLSDYFVIATGFSSTQVRAIARSIEDAVEEQYQRLPLRMAGQSDGNWILLDYGDVIAHIFLPQQREFYSLEAFWGHAERVPVTFTQRPEDSLH